MLQAVWYYNEKRRLIKNIQITKISKTHPFDIDKNQAIMLLLLYPKVLLEMDSFTTQGNPCVPLFKSVNGET